VSAGDNGKNKGPPQAVVASLSGLVPTHFVRVASRTEVEFFERQSRILRVVRDPPRDATSPVWPPMVHYARAVRLSAPAIR